MKNNTLGWFGAVVLALFMVFIITDQYNYLNPTIITKTITKPVEIYKTVYVKTEVTEAWWATLLNIESGGGKNRYRPKNKNKNCKTTSAACGHHQLTKIALKDINCKPITKCMANRDNYQLSQQMANQYNNKLTKYGATVGGWKRYVWWNQGPSAKIIFNASKGKAKLNKVIRENMANNSPYSIKQYKSWGSTKGAKKFLAYRKKAWERKVIKL